MSPKTKIDIRVMKGTCKFITKIKNLYCMCSIYVGTKSKKMESSQYLTHLDIDSHTMHIVISLII